MFNYLNIFIFVYFGNVRPLIGRRSNRQEIFNEYCLLLISVILFCFSDFVVEEEAKYLMGFALIFITCLTILVAFSNFLRTALN